MVVRELAAKILAHLPYSGGSVQSRTKPSRQA
jgi:hypothetical protein